MQSPTAPEPLRCSPRPASAGEAFGVYVHWPFCASKCPYCDFNSHVRSGIDEERWLQGYLCELEHWQDRLPGRSVSSIFFGGGTPSLMQPRTVAAILEAIARGWQIDPGAEITLEANPSSVEADRFRGYRAAGVNRASLGVQSLNDVELRALGRLHSSDEARAAIQIAGRVFDRFSFDLIYARPGQSVEGWRAELTQALALAGGHLSLYQLTIEPETPFAALHARGKLRVPDPEAAHDLYEVTQEVAGAAGLPAYEISNHAAPAEESRHNLLYWRYGEYVGIGAGAHGRPVIGGQRHATSTERQPERWLERVEREGCGVVEQQALDASEQADEALLMGLRLSEGLDLAHMAKVGGSMPRTQAVEELAAMGLLERCGRDRIRATRAGRFVLNEIVLRLAAALEPVGSGRSVEVEQVAQH